MDLLEVFPNAKVLMVEAQQKKETILKRVIAGNKNVDYVISLLSSQTGIEKMFSENETASQIIEDNRSGQSTYTILTPDAG